MAVHSKPEDAAELKRLVVRNRPIARPNDLMLEYADDILGWDGKLADLGGHRRHPFYQTA